MRKHQWRALVQYKLTDEEARQMIEGYGHPEIDDAPVTMLASDQTPAVGDPRVFLGTHNLLQDQSLVVCWQCEEAWTAEIAVQTCQGESMLPDVAIGNVNASLDTIGRNDPCPCGSGKKFKRCHGA